MDISAKQTLNFAKACLGFATYDDQFSGSSFWTFVTKGFQHYLPFVEPSTGIKTEFFGILSSVVRTINDLVEKRNMNNDKEVRQ